MTPDVVPLRATVRLQLHEGFTFADAQEQVAGFAALGISHLYLSPVQVAVPGSTHGYDGVDPTRISPALGGEDGLRALAQAARAQGMGVVLDIVPNHLAAHPLNPWWQDLLRNGRGSVYAGWFDVEWDAPGCAGRLWLPVLDRPLHAALHDGLLQLAVQEGEFVLRHHDQVFPVALSDGCAVPAGAAAREAWCDHLNATARQGDEGLATLVAAQPYQLAWWRTGSDQINYRRFFDISGLVALRMEVPKAFAAMHALPLRLASEGIIDGVRVDHVDGLADPRAYLHALRAALDAAGAARALAPGTLSLHVEKILAPGEGLPDDWACDGTTGYDFMDQCGALLHVRDGIQALCRQWIHAGGDGDAAHEEWRARRAVIDGSLQAEYARCLRAVWRVAETSAVARDLSRAMFDRALRALLARFPVYRTYAVHEGMVAADVAWLEHAAQAAALDLPRSDQPALRLLVDWLRSTPQGLPLDAVQALRQRVEQSTAPLNAKAVEDTVFYRHGVLLSRNEVGSHPAHLPDGIARFHAACECRHAHWPRAMLATATHDHKRGEDVRVRLALLSAWPSWWAQQVALFERLVRRCSSAPPVLERLMLWQTLVGAWPLLVSCDDAAGCEAYAARLRAWWRKALREGKRVSSWVDPDAAMEEEADALVDHILLGNEGLLLRRAAWRAAQALGPAGARNGLVQATLRLTCPGVPDLYQGGEGWDLSLVDPDNRRPVDYAQRQAWRADARDWTTLLRHWRDGAVKAQLLRRLLQVRVRMPDLFLHGDYTPLEWQTVEGAPRVLGFLRSHGVQRLLVIVVLPHAGAPDPTDISAQLPEALPVDAVLEVPRGPWHEVIRGDTCEGGRVAASTLLARSPVAVWCIGDEAGDGQD